MDIHLINRKLSENYGKDFLGQPLYRVVWSNDQLEKRFAEFTDWVPNTNILLRRVKEVREVKKYPYLDHEYVLEKLFRNQHNDEILDNKTLNPLAATYEPMWAFGHEKNGRAKYPIWRAIELIIISVNNPKKLTPSQMNDKEFEQALEDERLMTEFLNTHIKNDSLHSSVQDGDTIMMNDVTGNK